MKPMISAILLAGGTGSRMQSSEPKQFLKLQDKPIALFSFEKFLQLPEITEIIVVCPIEYRHLFKNHSSKIKLKFANPGNRRQDSVFNGLQEIDPQSSLACIHDSARPFVTIETIKEVIETGLNVGAAAVAVPLKSTVKRIDSSQMVMQTPNRSTLWEVQTPQAIRPHLLHEGFAVASSQQHTVTDDVSLVELLGLPVKLVLSCYTNIKVTTPDDLLIAEAIANAIKSSELEG